MSDLNIYHFHLTRLEAITSMSMETNNACDERQIYIFSATHLQTNI